MTKAGRARDVGSVLQDLLQHLGIGRRVHEQLVLEQFERIMGAEFSRRARAVKIERGVLFLEVTSGVWRQELFFQKRHIRERINTALGEALVKDIVFR